MDSVNALLVFVQVADSSSFVGAAQHLGVSASAVSKTIARLEERIGVRLFHRSTRSITLTAEGTRFLERCRRILSEIEAAEQEFAETATQPKGKLRVSLPMLGEPFISTFAGFQRAWPDVELDVLFSDRTVDLVEEGYDVVLRTGDIGDSRLTAKRLGSFRMVLVASPDFVKEHGQPSTPDDLWRQRCILFRLPDTGKFQPWLLQGTDGIEAFQPPAATICSSVEARLGYALEGVGIAYLPDFSVRDHLVEGRLLPILNAYSTYSNSFHMLWSAGRHVPPKLRAFLDHVSANLPLNP